MNIPEGWPTEAMLSAAAAIRLDSCFVNRDYLREVLSAALAAAPTPPAQEGLKVEFTKEWCMKMAQLEGDSAIGAGVPEVEHVAVVINNNQPGWENIIETRPYVTLDVGTKLYTHPANDGLRKAAEEAQEWLMALAEVETSGVDPQTKEDIRACAKNLRAELEKK